MITLEAYWKGRDVEYANEITDAIRANAQKTVDKANELLARAGRSDINTLNSGFRPRAINDSTANAASGSKHLTAEAVDLPDRDVGSSRVDLQACKLEYSIVSPK